MPTDASQPTPPPDSPMMESPSWLDALGAMPGVRAGWIGRVAGLPVDADRDEAMRRLRPFHERAVLEFNGTHGDWWRAEQIHGNRVAVVPECPTLVAPDGLPVVPGVDGLITCRTGAVLAIYVADCGAIWLADRGSGAVGLLHSGKKGTQDRILPMALGLMAERFGTRPADVTAVLGPCIRPPDYEVDFAAEIGRQAARAGIGNFIDCGLNTACDSGRYYSYRKELGKTGRMMALIVRDALP